MRKRICIVVFFFALTTPAYASYVLPYPSYMPGNKLYTLSRLVDRLKQWWHWGSIASFKYHLSLSDKYFIEAKTLFDYKQYLLALDALRRSNEQFQISPRFIERANREGKDTTQLRARAAEAVDVHIEKLEKLKRELPHEFLWTPEKVASRQLDIFYSLDEAIQVRQKVKSELR